MYNCTQELYIITPLHDSSFYDGYDGRGIKEETDQ